MTQPSALAADINPYWIKLTWTPLTFGTDTGRDTITFYDLQWDQGTNQVSWTSVQAESAGVVTLFNLTSVTIFPIGGKLYFRLRAKNNVGYGPFSTAYEVLCDDIPQRMNTPAVTTA